MCRLVLDGHKWKINKYRCPNCKATDVETKEFSGMISLIMPQESWVAKWNELQNRMPGVYAVHVIDNDIASEKELLGLSDAEVDDWIVKDGEGEE